MELKANDIKLQHKAAHCNSGNFTSRSCTAISIQGFFLSISVNLLRVVGYERSQVSHIFCCPVNLRGLRLDKCPILPREIKGEISASVEERTFPYAPTIRSCSTSSGLLSKKPFSICKTEAMVPAQRSLLGQGQLRRYSR